jgi:hypothetical protein
MRSCSSSTVVGSGGTYTLSFKYPQRKKSQTVRSGDLGRGALAQHLVISSSAANPFVWQVLNKKHAYSEIPVQYLQSHIYKNIPVSFDFITT